MSRMSSWHRAYSRVVPRAIVHRRVSGVMRHGDLDTATATPATAVRRCEVDCVNTAVAASRALNEHVSFQAVGGNEGVRTGVAVAHSIRGFVLHDAIDSDVDWISVRIRNPKDRDLVLVMIGRPDFPKARTCMAAIRPHVVADITSPVVVRIFLARVGHAWAVVAYVTDSIPVGVRLIGIGCSYTVVACISDTISVRVSLRRVESVRTVVAGIRHSISITIRRGLHVS